MTEEEQNAEQQKPQPQHKQCPMLKHHANLAEVALTIPPRDENLYADSKTHRQGGEDKIIQARHHGGTQFDGAKVTQECGVSKGDDGLRKITQHDGVRDTPDLSVRNGGFNHRLANNEWQKYTIPRILFQIFQSAPCKIHFFIYFCRCQNVEKKNFAK
jgi:hypothetical protein